MHMPGHCLLSSMCICLHAPFVCRNASGPCIVAWLADLLSDLQFVLRHCNFLALVRPENAYTELLSVTDSAMMPWLRKFQVSPGIMKCCSRLLSCG